MSKSEQAGVPSTYAGDYAYLAYIICDEHDNQRLLCGADLLRRLTCFRIPKIIRPKPKDGRATHRLGKFLLDISANDDGARDKKATENYLQDSRFLIVIASTSAAASARIIEVIKHFKTLPQSRNLLAVTVDDRPEELSNLLKIVNREEKPDKLLAPNFLREPDSAVTGLAAAMIGRGKEDLLDRFRRQRRQRMCWAVMASVVTVLLLIIGWLAYQPLANDVQEVEYLHAMAALEDAWNRGDTETALALLRKTGSAKHRSFEWYHWNRRLNRGSGTGALVPGMESDAGRQVWKAHSQAIDHIALSRDGRVLITSSEREVAVWSTETGSVIKRFVESQPVTALALGPRGRYWATGDVEGQVQLRSMPHGDATLVRSRDGTPIHKLSFSPQGAQLLLLPRGKYPVVLNNSADLPMERFSKADSGVELISLSQGTTVGADVPSGSPLAGLLTAGSRRGVQDAVYLPGGSRILSVALNGFLELWDAHARRRLDGFAWGSPGARTLAVSADGSQILTTGAYIYNPSSFLTEGVDVLVISEIRDGAVVRSVSKKRPNRLTGPLPAMEPFGSETPLILDGRFVDNIARVITLDREQNAIEMLETGTMTRVLTLHSSKGHPQCIDVAEDGTRIAAGTDEGMAALWFSDRPEADSTMVQNSATAE
ncbi:MAG: WD40 repeat domain-containing protein [Polyangiaceae bacterium]|nr:WD40 repeat domain-containing protein [Polyangiaceae bacterium]